MLNKLKNADYEKVKDLFQSLAEFQPLVGAVLAGVQPGHIFVDDPDEPRSAFLNMWGAWSFLAGEPDNPGFIKELNKGLNEREVIDPEVPYQVFTVPPQWVEVLADVFSPREPIPSARRHYTCTPLNYKWCADPPEGFTIQPMEVGFLDDHEMELPFQVQETLERWKAIDHPDFKDVGFVALKGKEICAWATVDGIANGVGDAGLVTQEPYRRKGLAAATTAAAIEQAFKDGLKTVHWTCQEQNIGSIKTAEKLGFELHSAYEIYMLEFDEFWYLAQIAPIKLKEKKYQEALEMYQKALELNSEPPPGIYFNMASAQAGLDDQVGAFKSLRSLAKVGWNDVEKLKEKPEFELLHKDPQWGEVMGLVEGNIGK